MFNANVHRWTGRGGSNNITRVRNHLEIALPIHAGDIAALRVAAADYLTAVHGPGPWSGQITERGVRFDLQHGRVFVLRRRNRIVAALTLSTRKPWAIDPDYFTARSHPLYLTAMAVAPDLQMQGLGRRCLEDAKIIARHWPGDVIRLDAYDAAAGAGEFYRKCGFGEVGRASYRGVPLIYFERLV